MAREIGTMRYSDCPLNMWGPRAPQATALAVIKVIKESIIAMQRTTWGRTVIHLDAESRPKTEGLM